MGEERVMERSGEAKVTELLEAGMIQLASLGNLGLYYKLLALTNGEGFFLCLISSQ
jgi:hypothetical protein